MPRLAIFDAGRPDKAPTPVALPPAERLEWYRWTGVDTLLVSLVLESERPTTRLATIDLSQGLLTQIPLGRFGEAEEIASVCRFLASDASRYITGQVLRVDGGMMM